MSTQEFLLLLSFASLGLTMSLCGSVLKGVVEIMKGYVLFEDEDERERWAAEMAETQRRYADEFNGCQRELEGRDD